MSGSKLPRVVLVGGPPRSGKGTIARKIAAHLGYDQVSTDDAVGAHEALFPAVADIACARAEWGNPAVIEGWTLMPSLVCGANFPATVRALWLLVDRATLEARSWADQGFWRGASDESAMIAKFTERSVRYNAEIEDAERAGAAVVRVGKDETADAVTERILALIET